MSKHELFSPLPGTFYRRAEPGAPCFKEVGATVAEGEVIGLIEVMKQYTEVIADAAGVVADFLVEDGDMVEPGQVLVRIQQG